ncbi:UDP-glucuronosyltransferase 2A3 isoform X3 [Biomphalaria glabrata]|nr:UDP-glucuronosyltransferase 2A3 isoform X3 [Biomphalaria glabrata]
MSLTFCSAKNVVMFPSPTKSYLIYHANIAQALTELGHNVTICVPDYLANKGLIRNRNIHVLRYGKHHGDMEAYIYNKSEVIARFWRREVQSIQALFAVVNVFKDLVEKILSDPTFIPSIQDLNPDFLVIESFQFIRNMLVLPYKLDIPFGLIGPSHDYFLSRVPFNPASEPLFSETGSDKKTFTERVKSAVTSAVFMFYDISADADVVSRYAPEKPYMSIRDIALKAEVFIAETDHVLDYPRSSLPNTKLIGGSSVSEAKPLSGEIKKFVEDSAMGVAVVSFGGGEIYVPQEIQSKMIAAFKKLDLNVVWKFDWASDQTNKILALKWIPQNDLLGHPKTKVFVSHCGKNGQYEALYHGVPILCLPIYGDQLYNSKRIAVKEFGLHADIRDVTPEKLTQLIQQVADDSKYRTNIQKASQIFKELYKIPSKEAAFWFDHVMKYGGSYMRSSGQQMPLHQFLLLDVIAYLSTILVVSLLAFYKILRLCINRFKKTKVKTA